jgi:hypothetical protein
MFLPFSARRAENASFIAPPDYTPREGYTSLKGNSDSVTKRRRVNSE